MSDELPEAAAQRPVRRRAAERQLRGEAGHEVRLAEGLRASREAAGLGRGDPRSAAARGQPPLGDVVVAELLQRSRQADTARLAGSGGTMTLSRPSRVIRFSLLSGLVRLGLSRSEERVVQA